MVPIRAGKLAALNYVRQRYGFAPLETVACGDSGNDILMLQVCVCVCRRRRRCMAFAAVSLQS